MRISNKRDKVLFHSTGYLFITLMSVICLVPFIMVISGSFSDEKTIITEGYRLIPKQFSILAYKLAFRYPVEILRAYGVTVSLAACGTLLGLFVTSMTAFALMRPNFKYRNIFSLYFYFTTLFSAGLVPWYILMIKYLHMKNSYLALLLPQLIHIFDIILMRSFMKSVPEALAESAKIDGAGEFFIYTRIYLPLSKPALATIGLFIALRYWNDWYLALLYISKPELFPLQFYLYKLLTNIEYAQRSAAQASIVFESYPTQTFKLAMTVVATGPIILLYPFVQKYFIRGLIVGAVKG